MKQVRYFEGYFKNEKVQRYVDCTEDFKTLYQMFKKFDKYATISYVAFDDGTKYFQVEFYNITELIKNGLITLKELQENEKILTKIYNEIKEQQKMKNDKATEQTLADFRKLSKLDKYIECQHYGVIISNTDIVTIDGYLTTRIFEIYNTKFVFILLSGDVIGYYELQ